MLPLRLCLRRHNTLLKQYFSQDTMLLQHDDTLSVMVYLYMVTDIFSYLNHLFTNQILNPIKKSILGIVQLYNMSVQNNTILRSVNLFPQSHGVSVFGVTA